MTPFRCTHCDAVVFFENAVCGGCGAWLAFDPAHARMQSYRSGGDMAQAWQPLFQAVPAIGGAPASTTPCLNHRQHGICNWMVDDADQGATLCRSCRLTRTIPDLSVAGNTARWARIEQAKRRLVYGLQLLGHLRHEAAHYLQYRWIDQDAQRTADCRAAFGDERTGYAQAMQRHYAQGAPADWPGRFISSYASMHPWEDWAETCAHWLLIVDAVQTAASWGLRMDGHMRARPQAPGIDGAIAPTEVLVLQQWLPVAQFLNAMHRSIGSNDSYPFQIPPAVLDKLATVQTLLLGARADAATLKQAA